MIAEVLKRLADDERRALKRAYELECQLSTANRALRNRREERDEYERTGILPRRLRRLAIDVLRRDAGDP